MGTNIIKISFVIVEYHSVEDIISCSSSIKERISSDLEYEIIVSSNSVYSKEQQTQLVSLNKNLRWVFNEKNGGFAYAMNQGLSVASGDILVIMNPDVRIKQGIEGMMEFLFLNNNIGIIAPKIVNANGVLQDSFRYFITPWNFLKRHLERLLMKKRMPLDIQKLEVQEVDWAIGAFMMTTRSAYEKVGGLDDGYFMYCEDMDWCKRMHFHGYSVVYYPQAVIEYEGTRSARRSWKYAWVFIKSLFRYWSKYLW